MQGRIYLDNAATTKLHPEVSAIMAETLEQCYGNPSSIHAEGRKSKTLLEEARKTIASRLGASTGEIFFTSCGTESNNMVLFRSIRDLGVKTIISSPTEHPSVLEALKVIEEDKLATVKYLNTDEKGNISLDLLRTLLEKYGRDTLVCLMHANNEIGTLHPIEKIADICDEHNAYFHTDATQSLGKFHLNLSNTPIHFMAASAHKFHGPKGIGILYVKNENQIKPFIFGGGQERKMRSGTENIAGAVGMAKALDLYLTHLPEWHSHIDALRSHLKNRLKDSFDDIAFNGDQDNYLFTVLSVSFPMTPKTDLLTFQLDIEGISASAGSACSSGTEKASPVLEAIQFPEDRKAVRFSFSYDNTMDEMDRLIQALQKILAAQKVES